MSAVLERVNEKMQEIEPKLDEELQSRPFSRVLRRETWSDHGRAEHSPFEMALVMGTVPVEAYRDLLGQVWHVYSALEERAEELKDDPVGSKVIFPELNRREAVEQDLAHYYGPDWRDQIKPLPVTEEYVARIKNSTPGQFVAHHYNRYLADLSGGFMIDEALKKAWNLGEDGRRYYMFPGIPDATAFKKQYRKVLDELPVADEDRRSIIEETFIAYELNIDMVDQLAETYGVKG
jgi:heme oxygenase (biliverdin-producing, ferredoxin)